MPLDTAFPPVQPVPRANAIPTPDAVRVALATRLDRVNRNRTRREERYTKAEANRPGRSDAWMHAMRWIAPYPRHWDCPNRWDVIRAIVPGYAYGTMMHWKRRPAPIVALAALRHAITDRVNDAIAIIAELDAEIARQQALPPKVGGLQVVKPRDGDGSIPRSGRRWNQR